MEQDLKEIRRAIRTLMLRLAEKDATGKVAREWRMVALVLDRIFFWCYLVVIITAGLALLLPKEPSKTINETIKEYSVQPPETTPSPQPLSQS